MMDLNFFHDDSLKSWILNKISLNFNEIGKTIKWTILHWYIDFLIESIERERERKQEKRMLGECENKPRRNKVERANKWQIMEQTRGAEQTSGTLNKKATCAIIAQRSVHKEG